MLMLGQKGEDHPEVSYLNLMFDRTFEQENP